MFELTTGARWPRQTGWTSPSHPVCLAPCSPQHEATGRRRKREESRREPSKTGEEDTAILGLAGGRILVIFLEPTSSNYLTT